MPDPPAELRIDIPPGTGEGYEGARDDVTEESCLRVAEGWVTEGVVANPTGDTVDYRVYTSLSDAAGQLRVLVQSDVPGVGPGGSGQWRSGMDTNEDGLVCVLRIERTRQSG